MISEFLSTLFHLKYCRIQNNYTVIECLLERKNSFVLSKLMNSFSFCYKIIKYNSILIIFIQLIDIYSTFTWTECRHFKVFTSFLFHCFITSSKNSYDIWYLLLVKSLTIEWRKAYYSSLTDSKGCNQISFNKITIICLLINRIRHIRLTESSILEMLLKPTQPLVVICRQMHL